MAVKSSKHRSVQGAHFILNGGLNYSQTPSNIADNEVRRANNYIYDPATDFLVVRPGTSCQTATALKSPILNGCYYYNGVTETGYHVLASGGKLYYLSGVDLDEFTEIGVLSDADTVPCFLVFNATLLIADGGEIRTWDGTVYAVISGSPKATVLHSIGNRVVANASDEPDSVYLSGPEDEKDWDTNTGNAIGFRAGYGDALRVNAFGVFNDDLIIFKQGAASKKIYRLNVSDPTPGNWDVAVVSFNNCAENHQSTADAWNNVFFVDSNGYKSIRGVDVYGDLQVDIVGDRINTVFTDPNECDFMNYIPRMNAVWFGRGDRVFCYTERPSDSGGQIPAFTEMTFGQGRILAAYQSQDDVFLCGYNGYVYKIDYQSAVDEVSPGVTQDYQATLRTKTLTFEAGGILRRLRWYLRPLASGRASLLVYKSEAESIILKTIDLRASGTMLVDGTGDLADADGYLYEDGSEAWVETCRSRVRNDQMAFEISSSSGRVGVEWVQAQIAMVEG